MCGHIEIAAMKEEDLPSVLTIEHQSHADPWTENLFRNEMRQPFSRLLVARCVPPGGSPEAGDVTGFVCFWCVMDELQIHNVAVHRAFRQRGIGRLLLTAAFVAGASESATFATLDVRASNTAALALYRAFGFEVTGIRPNYYGPQDGNAILMQLSLDGFAPAGPASGSPPQDAPLSRIQSGDRNH